MTIDAAPSDEGDVRDYVRTLTEYSDDDSQLPRKPLQDLTDIAKLRIYNRTGSESFFSDSGLGQALVGVTAILAKARVENYSVSSWSIGDETIDTSGMPAEDSIQVQQWNEMHVEGLQSSSSGGESAPMNTSDYIGGWD